MDYSEKMLAAFEDTVQVYEQAIADIDGGRSYLAVKAFKRYGGACKMCRALPASFCDGCLIEICKIGSGKATFARLLLAVQRCTFRDSTTDLRPALVARLDWLLWKAEQNGIVMVENEEAGE